VAARSGKSRCRFSTSASTPARLLASGAAYPWTASRPRRALSVQPARVPATTEWWTCIGGGLRLNDASVILRRARRTRVLRREVEQLWPGPGSERGGAPTTRLDGHAATPTSAVERVRIGRNIRQAFRLGGARGGEVLTLVAPNGSSTGSELGATSRCIVISGSDCTYIGRYPACDHLESMRPRFPELGNGRRGAAPARRRRRDVPCLRDHVGDVFELHLDSPECRTDRARPRQDLGSWRADVVSAARSAARHAVPRRARVFRSRSRRPSATRRWHRAFAAQFREYGFAVPAVHGRLRRDSSRGSVTVDSDGALIDEDAIDEGGAFFAVRVTVEAGASRLSITAVRGLNSMGSACHQLTPPRRIERGSRSDEPCPLPLFACLYLPPG